MKRIRFLMEYISFHQKYIPFHYFGKKNIFAPDKTNVKQAGQGRSVPAQIVNKMAKSLAQTLTDARLLASGIRKNSEILAKRGINSERASEIEKLLLEVEQLDNEQESLKARLKTASEELKVKTDDLKTALSTDIRIIKVDVPQALWKEFGIQAKK